MQESFKKRTSNEFLSKSLSFKTEEEDDEDLDTALTSPRVSLDRESAPLLNPIKQLGRGCFGVVFQANLVSKDNMLVAWKRMHKNSRRQSREYEMLRLMKGDLHCVQMIDFFYTFTGSQAKRDNVIQNFIMELCDDNLESLLNMINRQQFDLKYFDCKKIVFQLLLGVKGLHDKSICHRDLKPENIFYKQNVIKIGDLGSSKRLKNFESNTPYVVSRYYRAPELIFGIKVYSPNIDVFSVGVIFYELVTGSLPFKGKSEGYQMLEIFKNLGPPKGESKELYRILIGWHGSLRKSNMNYPEFVNVGDTDQAEEGILREKLLMTIPRGSKLKPIEIEEINEFSFKKQELEKADEQVFEEFPLPPYKKRFLQCKEDILLKSRISPLWSDDFELLFKIKAHRNCFHQLKEGDVPQEEISTLIK